MLEKEPKYPLVTIMVLNWNGKRFIDGFFSTMAMQSYPQDKIEIIFIDNNSSDDSVEYFLSKKVRNARLLQTGDNYGYAGGNNYGFKEAKGDFIAVCNNDLELDKDWLENLIKTANETNADVVVPKIIDTATKKISNAGSVLMLKSDWPNKERGVDADIDDPEYNKRIEVTAYCGASPLYKRSFLTDVGIYDKKFFLYWEDVDLAWRGQKKKKKYIYEPTAVVYHHTSGSSGGSDSPVFVYYVSRNRVLILLKNGPYYYALRAFALVSRDHVLYKIRDIVGALSRGNGRKSAIKRLLLGIRIILGILYLTPLMLLKRWDIIREETI